MRTIVVSGSAGLIGSETVKRFAGEGARVIGIDNDMREKFFGAEASTKKIRDDMIANVRGYEHHDLDIRDAAAVNELFKQHRGAIDAVVHTASQPSHDWAARDPQTDFTLRRHAKSFAAAGTAEALGNRARPRIRAGNFRDDEHRLHEAFPLWRV